MTRWRFLTVGRFALSRARRGVMWDEHGRWRHVVGPIWFLTDRGDAVRNNPWVDHYHWPDAPIFVKRKDPGGAP